MFNIGPEEILLILVLALIFLGPSRLPEVARQIGKGVREFRNLTGQARSELMRNVSLESLEATPEPETKAIAPAPPNGKVKGGRKRRAETKQPIGAEPAPDGNSAAGEVASAGADTHTAGTYEAAPAESPSAPDQALVESDSAERPE